MSRGAQGRTTEAAPGPQHLIDLRKLWVAIRRRRRMWLSFGVLGMLAGGLLALVLPPTPTAVTRILVVHEQDGPSDGGSLIRTDVTLMQTTRIADAALKKLGSTERPEDFLKEYQVTGLTNNVLELSVEGPTGAEAARRAKALADAFIADHVGRIRAGAQAEAKAITDQRTQVQAELEKVNQQISGAEAAAQETANNDEGDDAPAQPNAAVLDSLYAQRADLTDQISQLTQRAEQAGLGAPRVTAGTQIVDAPRPVRNSLKVTGVTNAGIGFVLGLVLGMTFAAVTGVVRDKPVLRKDIAEHLGASVIAQLPQGRRFRPAAKAVAERRRVAATLVRLIRDEPAPLSVLALGAPGQAATLAVDVAAELAASTKVALVSDPVDRIRADRLPTGGAYPVRLVGADDTRPAEPDEVRVGVGAVEPSAAWTDLPHLGGETVLVVRAGHAHAAWLHTVARQLADTGIPIVGVVLVDPDPRDSSDGTLWDGLHTALRGRAKHAHVNGANGSNGNGVAADLPTKRFTPVRKPLQAHDLPTTRFAPVRPAETDEPRRTQG